MAETVYTESYEITTRYEHPQSDDYVYYKIEVRISDAIKMPFTMRLKQTEDMSSFSEPPPEKHTIKAKNIIELSEKLNRWLRKYGYVNLGVSEE